MPYTIITPYLIPKNLQNLKAVNLGDGFILTSIKKLLYPFKCEYTLTSRQALTDYDIGRINSTRAVILAGANQLNDNFSVVPDFNLETLDKIKVPIIPFAIGIHGDPSQNQDISAFTKTLLKELHQRSRFTSWRCPETINYLNTYLPEMADQFLMTGCPVMYGDRGLSGISEDCDTNRIIVTVTERDNFWERETQTLSFVAKHHPEADKVLSLHQDFVALDQENLITSTFNKIQNYFPKNSVKRSPFTPEALRSHAKRLGYRIFIPQSVEQCFDLYQTASVHYGSRLHAHLWFLSQGKPSLLTYVDNRCVGFSDYLGFPLCDPSDFHRHLEQIPRNYRGIFQDKFKTMQLFTNYLKSEIL